MNPGISPIILFNKEKIKYSRLLLHRLYQFRWFFEQHTSSYSEKLIIQPGDLTDSAIIT